MSKEFIYKLLLFTLFLFAAQLDSLAQAVGDSKYLQLSGIEKVGNKIGNHIQVVANRGSADQWQMDYRILLRKMDLGREQWSQVLQEYLSFEGMLQASNQTYSIRFGRSQNRLRMIREDLHFPVEVEALYSITGLLFDEDVAISPVLMNRQTGEICNFQRADLDTVFRIYKNWFGKMESSDFSDLKWPLKGSMYMWLGEDLVEDMEMLIRKKL